MQVMLFLSPIIYSLSDLKGIELTGGTSGMKAKVIETSATDGTDPNTLFVEY